MPVWSGVDHDGDDHGVAAILLVGPAADGAVHELLELVLVPDASAGCACSYQNRSWMALSGTHED